MSEPRMLGLRLYLCASSALTACLLMFDPPENLAFALDSVHRLAVAALLLTVCGLIAVETLVNDVLGERWSLEWLQSWRHDEFLVLAGVQIALIFVVTSQGLHGLEMLRYLLDAGTAVYVAFRDVQLRYVKPRREGLNATHTH